MLQLNSLKIRTGRIALKLQVIAIIAEIDQDGMKQRFEKYLTRKQII